MTVLVAAANNARVVWALLLRDVSHRYMRMGITSILSLAEPIFHLLVLWLIFSFFGRGIYGVSLMLFLATGILPFFLFLHTSLRIRAAASGLFGRFPREQLLDGVLAHAIQEFAAYVVITVATFAAMAANDVQNAVPFQPFTAIAAFVLIAVFGAAVGMLNAVLLHLFPPWAYLYGGMMRAMIFLSGIHYMTDFMSPQVRDAIAWNPLVHGIELFRIAFYPQFPSNVLDVPYFLYWVLGSLCLGLCLSRMFRRIIAD